MKDIPGPITVCGVRFTWNQTKAFYENNPAGHVPYIVLCEGNHDGDVFWIASGGMAVRATTQQRAVLELLITLCEHHRATIETLEGLMKQ